METLRWLMLTKRAARAAALPRTLLLVTRLQGRVRVVTRLRHQLVQRAASRRRARKRRWTTWIMRPWHSLRWSTCTTHPCGCAPTASCRRPRPPCARSRTSQPCTGIPRQAPPSRQRLPTGSCTACHPHPRLLCQLRQRPQRCRMCCLRPAPTSPWSLPRRCRWTCRRCWSAAASRCTRAGALRALWALRGRGEGSRRLGAARRKG
mmetsp:Transcript_869/g.2324  ORF Transcript_869/g.2324 Transcript_869/m.2324 type:complete len:206 (+) Transcript_869:881-1498(+)